MISSIAIRELIINNTSTALDGKIVRSKSRLIQVINGRNIIVEVVKNGLEEKLAKIKKV